MPAVARHVRGGHRVLRLASAPLLVSASLAALITASAPAQAFPGQYASSIGTAVSEPVSGPVELPPHLVTSAPCPAGTQLIDVFVDSSVSGLVSAVAVGAQTVEVMTTDTAGISFGFTLLDVAHSQGRPLTNGDYDVAVVCYADQFSTQPLGQFDARFVVTGAPAGDADGTTWTFQPPGGVTGTATGVPRTGSTKAPLSLVTSAPCPVGSTAINAFVNSADAGLVDAVAVASDVTQVDTADTSGVNFTLNMVDVAGQQGRTLVNGSYDVSLLCLPDLFGSAPLARFDTRFVVTGGATPTSEGTTYAFQPQTPFPVRLRSLTQGSFPPVTGAPVLVLPRTPSAVALEGTFRVEDITTGQPVDLVRFTSLRPEGPRVVAIRGLSIGQHRLRTTFTPADPSVFTPASVEEEATLTAPTGPRTRVRLAVREDSSLCASFSPPCTGLRVSVRSRPVGIGGQFVLLDTIDRVTTVLQLPSLRAPTADLPLIITGSSLPLLPGRHRLMAALVPDPALGTRVAFSEPVTVDIPPTGTTGDEDRSHRH